MGKPTSGIMHHADNHWVWWIWAQTLFWKDCPLPRLPHDLGRSTEEPRAPRQPGHTTVPLPQHPCHSTLMATRPRAPAATPSRSLSDGRSPDRQAPSLAPWSSAWPHALLTRSPNVLLLLRPVTSWLQQRNSHSQSFLQAPPSEWNPSSSPRTSFPSLGCDSFLSRTPCDLV